MPHTPIERADVQAGTRDDAGTPPLRVLLFALLGGATAWSVHLLASYTMLAYGCSSRWSGLRPTLVTIALLALAVTACSGVVARRRWRVARAIDRPEDDAWDARMGEPTARVSFLMVTGFVLSLIFAIGIVYGGITIFLAPLCPAGTWS
jgi:hypothetical protein